MKLRTLLSKHSSDIALLVGNGINLFRATGENSWNGLLSQLAREHLDSKHTKVPQGISHTEFYDVLELAYAKTQGGPKLVDQFCALMASWKPMEQHEAIAGWAAHHEVPILTTNFENTLGDAMGCTFRRTDNKGFTDYYPWETYYSLADVIEPCSQFAIWHINGMQKYHRSIKLGLTQYMGSAARARGWLHNGAGRLLSDPAGTAWKGGMTWLQVFFLQTDFDSWSRAPRDRGFFALADDRTYKVFRDLPRPEKAGLVRSRQRRSASWQRAFSQSSRV